MFNFLPDASFSADKAAIQGCGGSNLRRNGGGGDTTISRSLQQRGWESSGSDSAAEQELSQASQAHDGLAQERLIRLAMIGIKWLVRPVAGRRDAVDCAILRGLVDRLL